MELVFGREAALVICHEGTPVSLVIRILPTGTMSQTLNLVFVCIAAIAMKPNYLSAKVVSTYLIHFSTEVCLYFSTLKYVYLSKSIQIQFRYF